ncbi:MAG: hypothetical protein PHE41_04570 [Eubacteriales bacterium]|nr:hypothetical protein [Eubacteriales bacterium]
MFKIYIIKLVFRITVFFTVLYIYLFHFYLFEVFLDFRLGHFTVLNVIWAILMLGMVIQMVPEDKYNRITMGSRKQFARTYIPPKDGYDKTALYEYTLRNNIKSWIVLLVWLTFNGIFALLYLMNIIGSEELILLSMFFYVADLICVIFWCPFQSFIMKNRCCINCRIFNWGHFMMYTPLLFIKGFYTWSLFFLSILVLVRWEITYAYHPYRFWEGSNLNLRCENCKDKMCKIKKPKQMFTI